MDGATHMTEPRYRCTYRVYEGWTDWRCLYGTPPKLQVWAVCRSAGAACVKVRARLA